MVCGTLGSRGAVNGGRFDGAACQMARPDAIPPTVRLQRRSVLLLAVIGLSLAGLSAAAELPDFPGKYTLIKGEAPKKDRRTGTLSVVTNGDQIQISRTWTDKRGYSWETNTYPLDGREAVYTSPGGVKGKGGVEFKGKYLFVRTVVIGRAEPSQPPVEIRQTLRLELSKDSKTLTVQTTTQFPGMPMLDMFEIEKYARD